MKCVKCPLWVPYNEWEGECLLTNATIEGDKSCNIMSEVNPKIVKGIPWIPDIDKETKETIRALIERNDIYHDHVRKSEFLLG